ncbi:hypothetical protein [Novosphingobium cyanobacteriorum]|uniref:Uncharacterized protein n=1 Tax=Novosphingobium cyanobacteriorum TaxID=3024215 RepID=A0ABT6CIV9_9SPHN|nr:hypothetical protein [Novosphingobium cyanobacteriorum]MDF8333473.1 hypothetical protein [Novosphingobium cyanobacteriorum]
MAIIVTPAMRQIEQQWAVCPVCSKHTAGKWARDAEGRPERRARSHKGADGQPCPGNDMPAILA